MIPAFRIHFYFLLVEYLQYAGTKAKNKCMGSLLNYDSVLHAGYTSPINAVNTWV